MSSGISDLAATGLVMTLGGPVFVVLCFAKLFGKIDIHWYWLAPFIQSYMVVATMLAFFGPKFTLSYSTMVVVVFSLSILYSALVFTPIYYLVPPLQIKRGYEIRIAPIVKFFGLTHLVLYSLAAIIMYGSFTNERCMQNIRCEALSMIGGYPHYNGSLFLPSLLCGTATIVFLVTLFACQEKEKG